ncbi:response regulator [Opitutus terrae]|nr:response regulator transcription factor [Opitutus terrae]
MKTIRVMVVDDHEVMRAGIKALLELSEDLAIVAEADNGVMATELAEETRPDVVVMDLEMPCLDGAAATRLIGAGLPSVKVVMVTAHESEAVAHVAASCGAAAFLRKDECFRELVPTIRTVAGGGQLLEPVG